MPDQIQEGDAISIEINDLDDGAAFSFTIQGIYPVESEDDLIFTVKNFDMPYSLQDGEICIRVENVAYTEFSLKKGETSLGMASSPKNGTFIRRESRSISSGLYEYITLKATPLNREDPVMSSMCLMGIKKGPQDAHLTFTIEGIQTAEIHVIIEVDERVEMDEKMFIGDIPTPQSGAPTHATPLSLLTTLCALAITFSGLCTVRR